MTNEKLLNRELICSIILIRAIKVLFSLVLYNMAFYSSPRSFFLPASPAETHVTSRPHYFNLSPFLSLMYCI